LQLLRVCWPFLERFVRKCWDVRQGLAALQAETVQLQGFLDNLQQSFHVWDWTLEKEIVDVNPRKHMRPEWLHPRVFRDPCHHHGHDYAEDWMTV
jgi:hypothetical protein